VQSIVFIALLAAQALLTGCGERPLTTAAGDPIGPAVSAIIGAAGGELSSADGRLAISVPAGAVASDTTFSIQPITSLAPTSIGASYRLEPDDIAFALPISLTWSIPEAGTARTSLSGIGLAYQDEDGFWRWLTDVSRDEASSTLTATTSHFSDHASIEGLVLSPGQATIDEGESITLQVLLCASKESSDFEGPPFVCECDPVAGVDVNFQGWSVNSIPGGNTTYGTITEGFESATFTAPEQKPKPPTVRVSVSAQAVQWSWTGGGDTEKALLFSYISIGPTTYKGTLSVTSEMGTYYPWTGKGEATWALADPQNENGDYTVTGAITPDQTEFVLDDTVCVLNESKQNFTGIGEIRKDPLGQYWTIGTVQWSATCTSPTGVSQVPGFLSMVWSSGCPNSGQWAPLSDPTHLTGSYTWNGCTSMSLPPGVQLPSSTVTWDFEEE